MPEIELSRTSDTQETLNTSFRRHTHMITSLFAFKSGYNVTTKTPLMNQ